MRLATRSFGKEPYPCQKPWPEDCFVQCGDNGIVFTGKGSLEDILTKEDSIKEVVAGAILDEPIQSSHYRTAFFEAFPRNPDTIIRSEGKNIEEAEEKAWARLQKITSCTGHEYERRGYKNGAGFCKHCNLFTSNVFEPDEECYLCKNKTYYGQTRDKQWYCEDCKDKVPYDLFPDWKKEALKWDEEDGQ
jgi:hypothetical protein